MSSLWVFAAKSNPITSVIPLETKSAIVTVVFADSDMPSRRVLLESTAFASPFGNIPVLLGRVDELFDDNPCGHQMNERQKGLAQFLIPCGNAAKLCEVVAEPFHLLA